ncbi:3-oxoacyl-[acyl-carrier-protein] synthase 3 [Candidatus Ornithobacterium hominis]|uniref:Beta-ketoacyl-[acyl-carrier-protein] synthase III n=1 Tax=Candidatus Ornithobacterium hominis TaxID=2497989 RepID=A0A383TW37_9FLAO|nr:beta-ketoacyl-ACP synthase III [Candidatus Ornithobacterium hominis]MCT7904780.1 ketoacyl-ACP synthase III [Candidatus Ornithobacterium hominis]SZD71547.1 3-oxoacyl-[acyl-carrier-protein] synthase 3 [Candidatus Ornithobacterium hominis]
MRLKNSIISGVGHYVPQNVVTNDDLSKIMETNDAWITERTGIKERRHVDPEKKETTSDLGYQAALEAIKDAGVDKTEIDFIIFATLSPDLYFPGSGVLLQQKLELDTIGSLDVRNQCTGFVYALATADAFIKAGKYKNILVVGAEVHSFALDMTTRGRGVSVIFGDGAGAVVLSASEEANRGIIATNLHSEGKYAEELMMAFPGPKYGWIESLIDAAEKENTHLIYPYMNGNFVFKHAVARFSESIVEVLKDSGYTREDLDLFIPHQANLRISQFIQKQLNLPDEKVFNNIQKYGNTTAASIPIALSEAKQQGRVKVNDLVCLTAFGSGFTWGSVLLRF